MADRLLIALLAAGTSRRLGQPKQLVRLNGEALIHRDSAQTSDDTTARPLLSDKLRILTMF